MGIPSYEVEVRGPLKDFDKILAFFRKNAAFFGEKDRLSLIYFPKNTLDLKEMQDDPRDLRLRVTNNKAELVMKYGPWATKDSRHEISIPIPLDKLEDTAQLLHYLDWSFGSILATKTFSFMYKDTEFALVKNKHLNYFEAERIIESKKTTEKVLGEIESICSQLGLSLFTEEEYFKFMDSINQAPGAIFDFRKQKFSEISTAYPEFFKQG